MDATGMSQLGPATLDPSILDTTQTERVRKRLRLKLAEATAGEDAEILTKLRGIVRDQVRKFATYASQETLSKSEMETVAILAKTHQYVCEATAREHAKYRFDGVDEDAFAELESAALATLGQSGDKAR